MKYDAFQVLQLGSPPQAGPSEFLPAQARQTKF